MSDQECITSVEGDNLRSLIFRLGTLIIIGMLVQLAVIMYVFYSNYQGRQDLVKTQRAGCERGKKDRVANSIGWRAAERAREATAAKTLHISTGQVTIILRQEPKPNEIPDLRAARKYDRIASGLEERARIQCEKQFPDAEVFA